jgi:hypothetical protein
MKFTEGSGVVDSIFGKSQEPIKMFLEARGEAYEQESIAKQVFMQGTSDHYAEKLTAMTSMDGFKAVGENGAYPLDDAEESYSKTLTHVTWKNSFTLGQELIEDAKIMDLKKRPASFIKAYFRTREKYGAALFGAAIRSAATEKFAGASLDIAAADKLSLFNAAHTNKVTGSTQCNLFADAFSSDALGMMETNMQNFAGDNDEILDVAPNTILIPNVHTLKKAVFAAIGADKDPETANNGYNYQFGRWNIIIWNYLNQFITKGTLPWLLLDTVYNEEVGGAVWLDRVELAIRSTIDENTDANVWRGRARFVAGFNDWRFAAVGGVSGATALS